MVDNISIIKMSVNKFFIHRQQCWSWYDVTQVFNIPVSIIALQIFCWCSLKLSLSSRISSRCFSKDASWTLLLLKKRSWRYIPLDFFTKKPSTVLKDQDWKIFWTETAQLTITFKSLLSSFKVLIWFSRAQKIEVLSPERLMADSKPSANSFT